MAITPDQALSILESNSLSLHYKEDVGWIVRDKNGVRLRTPPSDAPLAAIESASIYIDSSKENQIDRIRKRVIEEQQKGEFFAHPKTIQRQVDGETVTVTEFDIRKASDNSSTPIKGHASVISAWVEVIKRGTSNA